MVRTKEMLHTSPISLVRTTDNGHPERDSIQNFKAFGLGQTKWAESLKGIWGFCGQTITTILAL